MTSLVLALGLVNWLVTTILVESELFRPLRDWIGRRPASIQRTRTSRRRDHRVALWSKAAYLVGCHLCTGTWVGLALALAAPQVRPFGGGFVGWLLAGLLVKAIGHATLVVHKAGEALAQPAPEIAADRQATDDRHQIAHTVGTVNDGAPRGAEIAAPQIPSPRRLSDVTTSMTARADQPATR